MAKFRCNVSGHLMEVTDPADLKSLRKQPDYTEVTEDGVVVPGHAELLAFWHENRAKVSKSAKKDK
jgi:hypothetical protein